ncbi:MAG: 4-alpha-glucanotransferase [Alphaproteobacteria bacterium]|nr:4-alpha-glucanotransferase [Alphaproteobacteria bacterium]
MSDQALLTLAEQAGVAPRWRDAFGRMHDVTPDTLRAVLGALGLPAGSEAEISDSRAALDEQDRTGSLPPLVTAEVGQEIRLPIAADQFRLTLEGGGGYEGAAEADAEGHAVLGAIAEPGYHHLEIGGVAVTLAVAPRRCVSIRELCGDARPWGLAVQLYGLRRAGDGGIGDFAGLRDFVRSAARHGAAAVAISPVHAQFSADPDRFSPYAPSSRVMLNVLHAGLPEENDAEGARLEALPLVDWPAAARHRIPRLRRLYDEQRDAPALAAYRREQGEVLETHARFEALHAHFFGAEPGRYWNWRDWPDGFRDPRSPAAQAFARDHAAEIGFHAWLQYRADQCLAEAQAAARQAGMPIGLISDLAVGTDSGGSHAWSRQDETLIGLTVGAPPDLLSPGGQDWGLVAFSPHGLRQHGYAAFLEMLRAALRHAGGVRIDHAMGLNRLWVLPEGAGGKEGAYLHFPEQDLLRLVALESRRHRAIVLGEDLGTVPEGFSERLRDAGVMGLRVLWFERREEHFVPPSEWTPGAVAMTSTHDLPTVAGWWRGRDLDWRARLDLMRDEQEEREARDRDRAGLWQAFRDSGAAEGDPPSPDAPAPAVDAAIRHVGRAACDLVMLPVEDALGLEEQPNLPGTLHEHPNWQRRLPAPADSVLDDPACAARLNCLARARA